MERIPILQDNDNLMELIEHLDDEAKELACEVVDYVMMGRIPNRDKAAREALDVIQLGFGILDVLGNLGADIPVLMAEHEDKLLNTVDEAKGRPWQVERYIKIDWRGNDETGT